MFILYKVLNNFFLPIGKGRHEIKTIAVTDMGPYEMPTVWRVFSIIDNNWHSGQAHIGPGPHRLVFEINGEQYRGGIDDVNITLGQCGRLSKYGSPY